MDLTLKPVEKATLIALFRVTNGSLEAHVPLEALQSKFKKDKRGLIKKAIRGLCSVGLAVQHPTGGGMTYNLTKDGKQYFNANLDK